MAEITIMIDGVEYIARPKEEVAQEKSKTGYERAKGKGGFYYPNVFLVPNDFEKVDNATHEMLYHTGNYYTDKIISENNARADKLMWLLRQWQALNDETVDWMSYDKLKWHITYDYDREVLVPAKNYFVRGLSVVYFSTKEKAEEATKVFKDELTWYFTQYQSRLDEPRRAE